MAVNRCSQCFSFAIVWSPSHGFLCEACIASFEKAIKEAEALCGVGECEKGG